MAHRLLVFGSAALLAASAAAVGWALSVRSGPPGLVLARAFHLGPPLVVLELPRPGRFPVGSVPVLVRFPEEARVAPHTFRCLLNGHDVSGLLTRGVNGAGGAVWPLRPGSNRLEVTVFGRAWLGSWLYEDAAEVEIEVRPPAPLDRAGRVAPGGAVAAG